MKFGIAKLFAVLFMSSSAFAGINCVFNNIPNGGFPDQGPIRNDMFKFSGLGAGEGAKVDAFWTPFYNLSSETIPLKVVEVVTLRCPNCFDVFANTEGAQVANFKIAIRQDGLGNKIYANVEYKMNVGGPEEWTAFNETPGVCTSK
jgi:hypothetical protein